MGKTDILFALPISISAYMKNIITTLIILSFVTVNLFSQKKPPEITIKISEKSGFLGMGKARFAKIALSSRNLDKDLSSDNVNAGPLYFFTLKDSGSWKIDEDFIAEELPKLTITQSGNTFSLEAAGAVLKDKENYILLLSCKKTLLLHQPMNFNFSLQKNVETVALQIPQEYWPGYKKFIQLKQEGEKAFDGKKYQEALTPFEQLLLDRTLAIFPEYEQMYLKRLAALQRMVDEQIQKFRETLSDKSANTKQKISLTEEFIKKFTAMCENAAKESFQNLQTKDSSQILLESTKGLIERTSMVRDSLNQALDEQSIRWIVQGSSAGKIDFKYKYVIETFAYAYLSVDFADTTASALKVVVSEDLTARLQKYSLMNSYETFLRIVNKRWGAKQPMFPEGFLQNLAKDTAQFPLPFYSMLKSVEEYYNKNYRTAKQEIIHVMRKSYAYELTERIDQLRILINTIEKNVPMEVLQRIKDGYRAEEKGETEKAIEQYKDAILIAEDYAPAAFALGKLYDRNGDSYTANNFFQKAVTVDSLYYTAYRFLYINFFKNANFKPMIDLLSQAITYGNDFFDIHYYLGIAYNGSAQYDLAIQQYERALELNGKSIDANIQAGISYQNMKSYAKAREYFRRAISIDPENQTATDNLKRLDELQKKM